MEYCRIHTKVKLIVLWDGRTYCSVCQAEHNVRFGIRKVRSVYLRELKTIKRVNKIMTKINCIDMKKINNMKDDPKQVKFENKGV